MLTAHVFLSPITRIGYGTTTGHAPSILSCIPNNKLESFPYTGPRPSYDSSCVSMSGPMFLLVVNLCVRRAIDINIGSGRSRYQKIIELSFVNPYLQYYTKRMLGRLIFKMKV